MATIRKDQESGAIIFDKTVEEKALDDVKSEMETMKKEMEELRKLVNKKPTRKQNNN